ncbi:hypothetical protein R5R35_013919 [Gryllus longicercus]|uniref:Uncharacterized protein n=1 Tax=Gryllus longicercus TaxID=2509291 RepID=A0AAN9VSS2_9ORTH
MSGREMACSGLGTTRFVISGGIFVGWCRREMAGEGRRRCSRDLAAPAYPPPSITPLAPFTRPRSRWYAQSSANNVVAHGLRLCCFVLAFDNEVAPWTYIALLTFWVLA